MFNFLKRLFREEKKTEQIKIKLDALDGWYSKETGVLLDRIRLRLNEARTLIDEQKQLMLENIEKLRNAELKNKNIPPRAFQIMEGNRDAYMKRARLLSDQIDVPQDPYSAEQFVDEYNIRLDSFTKATQKPYMVMQEFFADESYSIAMNIKEIDRVIRTLKKGLDESNLASIEEGRDAIKRVINTISQIEDLKKKKEELVAEAKELEHERRATEEGLKKLEGSDEFKAMMTQEGQRMAVLEEKKQDAAKITGMISQISPALKKYSRISLEYEGLCKDYLFTPELALEKDEELKILDIIHGLRKAVRNDNLELKDKKKEKTENSLDLFNRPMLETLRRDLLFKRDQIRAIESELKGMDIRRRYSDISKRLEETEYKLGSVNTNIRLADASLERIDMEKNAADAEKKLLEILNKEVRIEH